MSFKKNILFISIVIFAFTSCKKNGTSGSVSKKITDVYIVGSRRAGNGNSVATYWKNGVAISLVDTTQISAAYAIAINDTDVYIVGNIYNRAVYWKNGKVVNLTDGSTFSSANTIAVSVNDIYIGGSKWVSSPYDANTVYWKNGMLITRPDIDGGICGIVLNGTDVYIAGTRFSKAVYWKNDSLVNLPNGFAITKYPATGMALNGNHVYVSGYLTNDALGGGVYFTGIYWSNGVPFGFDNTLNSVTTAITVNGADVYIAGVNTNGNVYWKNEAFTVLQGPQLSRTTAIAVNGGDVYVTGALGEYAGEGAVYWKNGVFNQLSEGGGSGGAYGIAIMSR